MTRGRPLVPRLAALVLLSLALVVPALSTSALQEPDPMFRASPARTGEVAGGAPLNNTTLWTYDTTAPVTSSPVVEDGKVYFGTLGGLVHCLNAYTGQRVWTYSADGPIESSPAVWGGRVYIGSDDSYVHCLDASNGSLVWRTSTDGEIKSSPVVSDGMVYVGSNDFSVYCLHASNGTPSWTFRTGGYVYSSPAVCEGKAYFGSCDGNVYAVDATSGDKEWDHTADFCPASPAVTDDLVIFGAYDGLLHYLDRGSGEQVHTVSAYSSELYSSAGLFSYDHGGSDDLPMVFTATTSGKMIGVGPDGEEFWNRSHEAGVRSSPMVVTELRRPYDPFIVYGDDGGWLHGIEVVNPYVVRDMMYDPPVEWHIQIGSVVQSSPFMWHDKVYVGAETADGEGRMVCIGSIDNETEVYIELVPTNIDEGQVSVACKVHNLVPDRVTVEFEGQVKDANPYHAVAPGAIPDVTDDPDGYGAEFPATPPEGMKPVIIRAYVDDRAVLTHEGQVMCLVEGWNQVVLKVDHPKDEQRGIKGVLVASGTVSSNYTIRSIYARWDDGTRINCTGHPNWTVALETSHLARGGHFLSFHAHDDYRHGSVVLHVSIGEEEVSRDVEEVEALPLILLIVIFVVLLRTKPPRSPEKASGP